jgi:hypothetical protein
MNKAVGAGPNVRLLKIVVIVLGVLMLAAAGGVIIGLVRTFGSAVTGGKTAAPAAAPTPAPFADRQVDLPKGARLKELVSAGERLVLRLELPGGAERLLVLDPVTGARLGAIDIRPAD